MPNGDPSLDNDPGQEGSGDRGIPGGGVQGKYYDPTSGQSGKTTEQGGSQDDSINERFKELVDQQMPREEALNAPEEEEDIQAWTQATTFGVPQIILNFGYSLDDGIFSPEWILTQQPTGFMRSRADGTSEMTYTESEEFVETVEDIIEDNNNNPPWGPILGRSEIGIDVSAETFEEDDYSDLGSTGYVYGLMYFTDADANSLVEIPDIVGMNPNTSAPLRTARPGLDESGTDQVLDDEYMHYTKFELDFLAEKLGYSYIAQNPDTTSNLDAYFRNLIDDQIEALTSQIYTSDTANQIVNKTIDLGPIHPDEITSIDAKEIKQGVSAFMATAPSTVTSGDY